MDTQNLPRKIRKILKLVIIPLIIAFPIRFFIIQPFLVKGVSMEPSFRNNEYLLADKISYFFKEPKREDVVIFSVSKKELLVKRIIGLPRETVQIKDGNIFIYNKKQNQWLKLAEKYLFQNTKTFPDSKIVLGENEYFVLGDNREGSIDSRSFGILPKKNIAGRAFIKLWPLSKIAVY